MGPRDGVSSVTETGEKTVSQLLMQRAVETDTGIKTNKYFSFFKGSVEQISSDHLSTELRVHAQFTFVYRVTSTCQIYNDSFKPLFDQNWWIYIFDFLSEIWWFSWMIASGLTSGLMQHKKGRKCIKFCLDHTIGLKSCFL